MSDYSNHPYQAQRPYTKAGASATGLDRNYGNFNHEVFAHTYIKRIETKTTPIKFPSFDKFYVDEMDLRYGESTIIEVHEDKIVLNINNATSDNSKHDVSFYTCKTCLNNVTVGTFNSINVPPEYESRPAGTLESEGYDRETSEGGCSFCHDEIFDWYQNTNSSPSLAKTNLIGCTA